MKDEFDEFDQEADARPHWGWPVSVLILIIALMASIMSGCTATDGINQISAGWETVKSRTEIGVGFKADEKGIAFPILVRWLAKPTPDDIKAERIEQTIVESDPPFSNASKQPVTPP